MKRRTFVQWLMGAAVALPMPRWLWARVSALAELSEGEMATLREIAAIVLPQSLGRSRTDEIAGGFVRWIRGYREGAELPSGYGFTRLERAGPNPALGYAKQLQQLDAGKPFAQLDGAAKRATIEQSLAKIAEVPQRPNGKSVAADLMSYFFHSSEGHDYLYDAAIRIEDCRGLPSSPKRPAREEA
ncbi:MAG TPA: hypothetical protein VFU76_10805 [Terriglobales bacterium]|nr:hypothetical protein [Terriglobales bacterium]